ncbi:bifunctional DNA primase/polymerase, partial [bacterium]|nr:bifunctional DNA primase/polymerase [bacterium]
MCNKALEWASRGRPVFPCGPDKRPLTSHGFKDASTEPSEIRQMWSMHPDAMIGMPTGKASGIVVLDFDLDEDKGFNAVPVFTELRAAGMVPEGTYTVRTPRGGLHVHLEASEMEIRNAVGYDGRCGFDIRGEGGYVIVPPSISARGTYAAQDAEAKPEPMPAELVSFLTTSRAKPKSTMRLGQIAEGSRNDSVFRRASALRGKGLDVEELLGAVNAFNETKCTPPLHTAEVQDIVRRVALEYEPNDVPSSRSTLAEAWAPVPIGEIDAGEAGDPVWGELVVKGGITLFSAREKIGKTTLCCMLINEAGKDDGGELLGQTVNPARVLVVSEESTLTWQRRREDEGLPDNLLVIASPSFMPDDLVSWREVCEWVADIVVDRSVDLVVFDTWAAFAPVESENDNSQVHRAAHGFRRISETGTAVLVFHHMAKAGGTRGGTALPAAADTIIEMRKPKTPSDDGDEAEDTG